jgi:glycogen debranching enzyme, archaeal type, putative
MEVDGKAYNLYSFSTSEYEMQGFRHLQRVVIDPIPKFIFSIGDVRIEKTVCMVYGENTVVIEYRIFSGGSRVKLRLTPLVNFRDYHHESSKYHMRFKQFPYKDGTCITPYDLELCVKLFCEGIDFTPLSDSWFEGMYYHVENERGLDCKEDHYIPGYFDVYADIGQEKRVTFIATTEINRGYSDGQTLISKERNRFEELKKQTGYEDEFADMLTIAADNFIVYRKSTDAKTIIAGYPWFTDWGRDTMISLCGLTLVTKRFKDAGEILHTFSIYIRYGLLPNMFPDEGQEPGYNSVDAALWYFEAINKYYIYTGNKEFVIEKLYNSMKDIIQSFMRGTLFNIGMDADYLIHAGTVDTQLTWMDAKVGAWVVTPRHGKAVEVNALWYNALCIMDRFSTLSGEKDKTYADIAEKVKSIFLQNFWNSKDNCLFDVISEEGIKDSSIRPNQVIAVSLSYPVLDGTHSRAVVDKVWKELYTSYGLRTLSKGNEKYKGVYIGDQLSRDGAYHQGTVWTWLLGHFITAFKRVYGENDKYFEIIEGFFTPFKDHFRDACIGNISEIFDGDEPLIPRGSFAQAWSVAEILRSYIEPGNL